ncbi:hypothetical protein [Sphingomonas elodea]|uniref:hypothetical protein n=1 Tax=Sphingomonas elodea TaxID=179878 RepID=UPI001ED8EED9|nr:hypothetical protein [Sphingomonas elodea]
MLFARFCDRAAKHLASGIALALTLNEPNLAGLIGEILPPQLLAGDRATQEAAAKQLGVPKYSPGVALYVPEAKTYRANMMEAHRRGVAAIKAVRSDLEVGVSLALLDDQAAGKNSIRDHMRERYYGEWLRLASETCDFIGVQNYERKTWDDKGPLPPPPWCWGAWVPMRRRARAHQVPGRSERKRADSRLRNGHAASKGSARPISATVATSIRCCRATIRIRPC